MCAFSHVIAGSKQTDRARNPDLQVLTLTASWPEGNENYTLEKVTEKHKPSVKTFLSVDEYLGLEDMFRLDPFECSKEVWISQSTIIYKVFGKICMFQDTQKIYFKTTYSLIQTTKDNVFKNL